MNHHQHPHRTILLSSSFQYPERRLFFARARLFLDRIELSGWNFNKREVRQIQLDELDQIEWNAHDAVFHLREGGSIRILLPQTASWRHTLEQRFTWSAPGRFPIAARTSTTARHDLPLNELVTFATAMG